MKILITGGLGFIGSTLLQRLVETTEHNITIIDRQLFQPTAKFISKYYCNPKVRIKIFDLANSEQVYDEIRNTDIVIHLAGLRLPECEKYPDNCFFANEFLTKMIGQICHQFKKRLIFSSTCSNYGKSTDIVDESSHLEATTNYASSKINAEHYLMEIPTATILRFATAYGIGANITREDVLVNSFVKQALEKKKLDIFVPHAHRPILHVDDIAKAIHLIIDNPEKQRNNVYNVGTADQNFEKIQIASKIANITKCKITVTEKDDPRDYTVSFKRFKNQFGFTASHNLDETIKELVNFFDGKEKSK